MNNIEIVALASLIATFFLIVACASPPDLKEVTTPLEDKEWILQSYGDTDSLTPVMADIRITAEFNRAEREITGSADYNSYFGGHEVDGKQLSTDVSP